MPTQRTQMEIKPNEISAMELRNKIIRAAKSFVYGLEVGSPVSNLEEVRDEIKALFDILHKKEQEEDELFFANVDSTLQKQ